MRRVGFAARGGRYRRRTTTCRPVFQIGRRAPDSTIRRLALDRFEQLLDRIDPRRHDVDAILDRLNAFSELPVDEQDAEEFGRWGYAGLDEAEHPLLGLVGEAHNDFCVVRDLDGSLAFLFQVSPRSERWESGPFYRQHVSDLELDRYIEHENAPLEQGLPLSRTEFLALLDGLPDDPPGPLSSF